jgi:hypothetical protein
LKKLVLKDFTKPTLRNNFKANYYTLYEIDLNYTHMHVIISQPPEEKKERRPKFDPENQNPNIP